LVAQKQWMDEMRKLMSCWDCLSSARSKALVAWWGEWMVMVFAVCFASFMIIVSVGLALGIVWNFFL
tara:strand:- start:2928 stop:3128 length:201 start_codon:yes stop_codon:yes gene_type:complete